MLSKGKHDHANIERNFFMNFLPEKKYGLPSWNFVKKNVLCEKGDEITRFDGTLFWPKYIQYYTYILYVYRYGLWLFNRTVYGQTYEARPEIKSEHDFFTG